MEIPFYDRSISKLVSLPHIRSVNWISNISERRTSTNRTIKTNDSAKLLKKDFVS